MTGMAGGNSRDAQIAATKHGPWHPGRFILVYGEENGYVTSWDTWDEAEAAFPIGKDFCLVDDETGREWLAGSPYEWEAART